MASRRKRSKTRSGASRELRDEQRLASITFFLDYQIGRFVVAEALRSAGAAVEVHIDHFPPAAPDTDWIPEVGRRELGLDHQGSEHPSQSVGARGVRSGGASRLCRDRG